jgi:hypothetical protein
MKAVATVFVLAIVVGAPGGAAAQDPPPIPWFVVDLHGAVAAFPSDPILAASRGLHQAELPGTGLGADLAVHLFPLRVRAVTVGVGGRLVSARARRTPSASSGFRAVTERFTYLGPQLSLNFGTGNGWSYLSAGIAASTWSVVPAAANPLPADDERLKTIDYGGGARWFAKPHLAFSFDVRLYAVNPSSPASGFPAGPRSTFLVVGVGVSLK